MGNGQLQIVATAAITTFSTTTTTTTTFSTPSAFTDSILTDSMRGAVLSRVRFGNRKERDDRLGFLAASQCVD